jgi:hypothetical protein
LVSSLIPNYGSSRDVGHLKVSDETIADIREKRLPKRFVRSVVDSLKKKNVGESIVFWIQQQGKLDQVFQVNPYFDLELAVQSRLRRYIENGGNGLDTSPMKSFAQSEISTALPDVQDTIVIVPDVHGSLERTQAVERLLATKKFEWLALEMIPHTLQPELNEFSRSLSTSESFAKARNALNDYFLTSWDEWFTLRTKPASTESQGFRVIDSAKAANTRIIGLDTSDAYERLADPLTMGVRNLLWASLIPRSGNGIVLGGALHFSDLPKGLMLQDFIWERQSERKLYSVTFS